MEELIVLLVRLLIKAFSNGDGGSKQDQARRQAEQQQAWEQQHREWLAKRQEWERQQAGQAGGGAIGGSKYTQPPRAVPLPKTTRLPTASAGRGSRKKKADTRRPPPMPSPAVPLPAATGLARRLTSSGATVAPRAGARSVSATAPALAKWLRPAPLRSQFVLTEILKPPLALRPPRDIL